MGFHCDCARLAGVRTLSMAASFSRRRVGIARVWRRIWRRIWRRGIRGWRILRRRWIVWRRGRFGKLVTRLTAEEKARIHGAIAAAESRTHVHVAVSIVP